jgi:FKBP-type peptidyl-prolyl cis-trans isomerase
MKFLFAFVWSTLVTFAFSTTPEGVAWLANNKEQEGVITLPSGLQYKVIRSGSEGGLSPRVDSPCECHYRGLKFLLLRHI